jgi:hypothetical protein
MNILALVNPTQGHQFEVARALRQAMKAVGDDCEIVRGVTCPEHLPRGVDAVVVWGWRRGRSYHAAGLPVLVMERAYLEDRFAWFSLGWNGLNGRATFPDVDDGGRRFEQHFGHLMKPWRARDGFALIMGQVPSDTAVMHIRFQEWAQNVAVELQNLGHRPAFRCHPKAPGLRLPGVPTLVDSSIELALDRAAFAVTFNSNSGVDAVLNGVPTVTVDRGAMAWDVTSHDLRSPVVMPDRSAWSMRTAFAQWRLEEIADGTAWAYVRAALPTQPSQEN